MIGNLAQRLSKRKVYPTVPGQLAVSRIRWVCMSSAGTGSTGPGRHRWAAGGGGLPAQNRVGRAWLIDRSGGLSDLHEGFFLVTCSIEIELRTARAQPHPSRQRPTPHRA